MLVLHRQRLLVDLVREVLEAALAHLHLEELFFSQELREDLVISDLLLLCYILLQGLETPLDNLPVPEGI